MKLYLVRHGQTPANVEMALDTALPGPPLTELGREQADKLAESLVNDPIAAVYSSYAVRARQTAAPVAAALGMEVRAIEGVHEIQAGSLEGRTDFEAVSLFIERTTAWSAGDLASQLPGGENGHQVKARFTEAVQLLRDKHELTDPDGIIVLVCHGGIIRFGSEWLADNVKPEIADKQLLLNTDIVQLETKDNGWRCVKWAGTDC